MGQNNSRYYQDGCTVPISVLFSFLLAGGLIGIAYSEYGRSKIRYDMEKIKYERFMDSIKKIDSTKYLLNPNLTQGR